jgi:hypothetical protein
MLGRHQPEIGHQLARIGKAREVAQFGDQCGGIDQRHAAHRLQRCHDRSQRPVRQHRLDLCRQPIASRLGSFDRRDVILEHNVMHRLLELEPRQPTAMQLGPCRPPVMAALPQQEARQLLACPTQRMHRVETGAHQVAYRLMPGIGNPHRCQLTRPMQPRQTGRIPPIRLDPVARSSRDQRWRHHDAFVPAPRQVTLDAIAARPRLVTEPQLHSFTAELARQAIQGRRRVRDPAIVPNLAPQAAFCYRHDDTVLVNIKPDIRDMIPHDPSPYA